MAAAAAARALSVAERFSIDWPRDGVESVMRSDPEASTVASAENRDALNRPLPKPPLLGPHASLRQRLARLWACLLNRDRRLVQRIDPVEGSGHGSAAQPATAQRERVRYVRGAGLAIQAAGIAAGIGLTWFYGLAGAGAGAAIAGACHLLGRGRSTPWQCGRCGRSLATARVRVCPRCHASLVDAQAEKQLPR